MPQTFNHAIIASHPEEQSFTMSVAKRYAEAVRAHGHEAVIRDLYRLNFDPVLKTEERMGTPAADVTKEWDTIGKPDVIVLVYPVWFGTPPAILKGYIDRVFGAGRRIGLGGAGCPSEQLRGKRLVSFTSSGGSRAWLDEKGVLMSLRNVYDRYLSDVFGFGETHRFHFDSISEETQEIDIRMHLGNVEKAAREVMSRMVVSPPPMHPNP